MGYDFGFLRPAKRPASFPCKPAAEFYRDVVAFGDLQALRDALVSQKGARPNGPPGERERDYWWNTPDGGSLDILLARDWIGVDTHAHWRFVLEAHECVAGLYPDALIVDRQSLIVYDAATFERFVEQGDLLRESSMPVNSQITDSVTQAMPLDQGIIDAIAREDLAGISERLTMLLDKINVHLTQQNRGQHAKSGHGSLQARSAVDVLTDNELTSMIADLKAAVDALATVNSIQRPG